MRNNEGATSGRRSIVPTSHRMRRSIFSEQPSPIGCCLRGLITLYQPSISVQSSQILGVVTGTGPPQTLVSAPVAFPEDRTGFLFRSCGDVPRFVAERFGAFDRIAASEGSGVGCRIRVAHDEMRLCGIVFDVYVIVGLSSVFPHHVEGVGKMLFAEGAKKVVCGAAFTVEIDRCPVWMQAPFRMLFSRDGRYPHVQVCGCGRQERKSQRNGRLESVEIDVVKGADSHRLRDVVPGSVKVAGLVSSRIAPGHGLRAGACGVPLLLGSHSARMDRPSLRGIAALRLSARLQAIGVLRR